LAIHDDNNDNNKNVTQRENIYVTCCGCERTMSYILQYQLLFVDVLENNWAQTSERNPNIIYQRQSKVRAGDMTEHDLCTTCFGRHNQKRRRLEISQPWKPRNTHLPIATASVDTWPHLLQKML